MLEAVQSVPYHLWVALSGDASTALVGTAVYVSAPPQT